MRRYLSILFVLSLLLACKTGKKGPDVSSVKANSPIVRFDQDFFAIDTSKVQVELTKLAQKNPDFYGDYMRYILAVSGNPTDEETQSASKEIIRDYTVIKDSLKDNFKDIKELQSQIDEGFKHVKYYFPNYPIGKVFFYIGPFEAPSVAVIEKGLAVGIQKYGGANFFAYQTPAIQEMYPTYIARRFEKEYIPANCMKAVAEDIFPDQSAGLPLIQQMIEKGKIWYLLDLFMPNTPDSLKTGYTQLQLDWCKENEGLIWSYLAKNEDLNSLSPTVINNYIGEAPFTQGLSREYSPGNLGAWIGWQIVKKYADKFPNMKVGEIMRADPAVVLEKAKYKPK
jgi:hypothetical protein